MDQKRILIVDDEKGFTNMLSLNLESSGNYDVEVENDPREAVSAALQYRPDLILLDVVMPGLEGPDVANAIRNHRELRQTPIIFLTATVTSEEVDAQGGRIGGRLFVAKPSKLTDLMVSIEKTLLSAN